MRSDSLEISAELEVAGRMASLDGAKAALSGRLGSGGQLKATNAGSKPCGN